MFRTRMSSTPLTLRVSDALTTISVGGSVSTVLEASLPATRPLRPFRLESPEAWQEFLIIGTGRPSRCVARK